MTEKTDNARQRTRCHCAAGDDHRPFVLVINGNNLSAHGEYFNAEGEESQEGKRHIPPKIPFRLSQAVISVGPTTTTPSVGRMKRMRTTTILTGAFCAFSRARWVR